jgi:hypothetical protein
VLHLKDLSIFERMTSLKTLDISDHPEFFLNKEELEEEQKQLRESSGQENKESIEFVPHH